MIHHITHFFKKVGYGLGSSRWLARSLVKHAHVRDHGNIRILELGAGRGNVTREILSHLGNNVSLTAIEYDIDRVEVLRRIVHPHLEVIHGDVQHLEAYCEHGSIDIVISTLPLGSFDPEMVEKVLGNIKNVLRKGGRYIQYQYWMANKKDIKRHFTIEKIRLEPRNFAPAFIYITEKV